MAGIAGAYCGRAGIAAYWGVLFAAILFLAVGNLVFLIRRHVQKLVSFTRKNKNLLYALEAAAAVTLLAVGIALRVQGMDGASQSSVYFEAAKVAEGQRMPRLVHGAVYYYIQLLHLLFLLVGNHFQAALWLQIALQLLAFVFLFFGVRRLAGPVAALVVLGFCACSPYMVGNALQLSPANLLLCVLAAAGWLVMAAAGGKLNPPLFFLAGVPIAFCCYIDIIGVLLLLFALGAIFAVRREPSGQNRRLAAVILCLIGTGAAFFAMVYVDALVSAKGLGGVLQAWGLLYFPEGFRIPMTVEASDAGLESLILAGVMAFGLFSFWGDKKEERMSVWVLGAVGVAAAECWGIFTEEQPGAFFLYLLVVMLAGIGFGQCFSVSGAESDHMEGDAAVALETNRIEDVHVDVHVEVLSGGRGPAKTFPEKTNLGEAGRKAEALAAGDCKEEQEMPAQEEPMAQGEKQIQYIENPLPLPKKHVKRVLDYPCRPAAEEDDFDYPVSEEDDFDI